MATVVIGVKNITFPQMDSKTSVVEADVMMPPHAQVTVVALKMALVLAKMVGLEQIVKNVVERRCAPIEERAVNIKVVSHAIVTGIPM